MAILMSKRKDFSAAIALYQHMTNSYQMTYGNTQSETTASRRRKRILYARSLMTGNIKVIGEARKNEKTSTRKTVSDLLEPRKQNLDTILG